MKLFAFALIVSFAAATVAEAGWFARCKDRRQSRQQSTAVPAMTPAVVNHPRVVNAQSVADCSTGTCTVGRRR